MENELDGFPLSAKIKFRAKIWAGERLHAQDTG